MTTEATTTQSPDLGLAPPVAASGAALSLAIFGADLLLPEGVVVPVLYIGLVLMSRATHWPPFAFWLAAAASLLTVVGYVLSPDQDLAQIGLTNRLLAIAAIWGAAVLCYRHTILANDLRRARDASRSRAARTAATAEQVRKALAREKISRSRTEDDLQESEQRYYGLFNQTFQLVAILAPDGTVEEANETLLTAVALPARTVAGQPIWALPCWSDGEAAAGRLRGAVRQAAGGDFFRGEFRILYPGAEPLEVDISIKPIRGPYGDVEWLILEARDVTAQKQDQELLLQAQKLEVVGQLTSGMAHDFNNLLTVISGNLELIGRRLKNTEDAKLNERVEKALQAAFDGRALTDQLLAFARKQEFSPRVVDLNEEIADIDDLLAHACEKGIAIETKLAEGLWRCRVDPAQIQAAVLNLVLNARDAMPEGGTIRIRTRNARLSRADLGSQSELEPGDYVALSVADSGVGIPAASLQKVVDPFFTTKPAGKGSGLGLSMVYGLVKQSGGDLRIDSASGQGTTMTLYFPRTEDPVESRTQAAEAGEPRLDACRALVVEDDGNVREIATSILADLQCEVEQAETGDAALALLEADGPFDVLITDIRMPGRTDGPALARHARAHQPDIEIVFLSAHPQDIKLAGDDIPGAENFITKPFRYQDLAERVAAIVERRRARPHTAA